GKAQRATTDQQTSFDESLRTRHRIVPCKPRLGPPHSAVYSTSNIPWLIGATIVVVASSSAKKTFCDTFAAPSPLANRANEIAIISEDRKARLKPFTRAPGVSSLRPQLRH